MTPTTLPLREFHLARRVQFSEVDAAGIVHFSWYPRYMEEAEHAMWREVGLTVFAKDAAYGWPRVAITMDYAAPLHFEDVVDVHLQIAAMGRSSIRYRAVLTRGATRVATGTMTVVCVQTDAEGVAKAIPLPEVVTSRFAVADADPA